MYPKAVFDAKTLVLMVKLLYQVISHDAEAGCHLVKCQCVQHIIVGPDPVREGIIEGKDDGFSGFLFLCYTNKKES